MRLVIQCFMLILCLLTGICSLFAQVQLYNKDNNNIYDFVSGQKIIFEDDFSQDPTGMFPSKWRLYPTYSTLDIGDSITNTGVYPIKKQLMDSVSYLAIASDNHYFPLKPKMGARNYLPDTFTLEFYFRMDDNQSDAAIVFFNEAGSNIFEVRVLGTGEILSMLMHTSRYSVDYPESFDCKEWHHLAVSYKNKNIKVYIDNYRMIAVPDCTTAPSNFIIAGNSYTEGNPVVGFTKVKLAAAPPNYLFNKILTENKFTTHAIYFATGQSAVEPQSMDFLQQLANWLRANPHIRLEIDGYTDNEGDPKVNLKLSQDRANAVKTTLEFLGVNGSRLTTNGYGEQRPIDNNETPEGRAQNRRVEFIKL